MIRKTVLALIVLTFRPALPMALAIDPDQESRDNRDLLRDSKSSKRTEPLNALLHLEARAGYTTEVESPLLAASSREHGEAIRVVLANEVCKVQNGPKALIELLLEAGTNATGESALLTSVGDLTPGTLGADEILNKHTDLVMLIVHLNASGCFETSF